MCVIIHTHAFDCAPSRAACDRGVAPPKPSAALGFGQWATANKLPVPSGECHSLQLVTVAV